MTAQVVAAVCLAAAVSVLPRSRAVRRRAGVFGVARGGFRTPRWSLFVATGGAVVVAVLVAFGIGSVVAAVAVAGTVALRWRRSRADRSRTVECGYLMAALEAVIGELRVGAHPSSAAEVAARESEGDAARAFAIVAARTGLGGAGSEGLRQPRSVVAADLGRIAEAWHVAEHHGLALAELLSAARTDLAGRIRFRARTTASLAGPRATAAVLACLPILGIALGQLMGAAPVAVLFGPGPGAVLLPLGCLLACAGLLWTDAITGKVLA